MKIEELKKRRAIIREKNVCLSTYTQFDLREVDMRSESVQP